MTQASILKLLVVAAALLFVNVEAAGRLPVFTRGVYLLLADKDVSVKNNQGVWVPSTDVWNPRLTSWI
jgi:hypothetical protein